MACFLSQNPGIIPENALSLAPHPYRYYGRLIPSSKIPRIPMLLLSSRRHHLSFFF